MERTTARNIERLRIRTPGPLALARQLSGGNQQKVLFAKWLETRPKVFVMDEPTIGVDVGAKDEIRKIIDEIAAAGVGVAARDDRARRARLAVRPRADHVPRRDRRRAFGRGDRTARASCMPRPDGSDSGGRHDFAFHFRGAQRGGEARFAARLKRSYSLIQALGVLAHPDRDHADRERPVPVAGQRRATCSAR